MLKTKLTDRFRIEYPIVGGAMMWISKADFVAAMGADVVTVVGYENGGATGRPDIGTMVLVPVVVDRVNVPVIGGGGISDGRGIAEETEHTLMGFSD